MTRQSVSRAVWMAMAVVAAGVATPGAAAPAGTIRLEVDAGEAPRKIFHAHLTIPARPGPLELYYPKWIPGEHGPTGPITDLAGLRFSAAGKPIAWRRDDVDMYALHCEVPAGASEVEISLDLLSPATIAGFSSGASATAELTLLSWNQVLLYPAGSPADEISYAARLRLPAGWKYATALQVERETAAGIEFAPVSLTTLVDSPVLAGVHLRTIPLAEAPRAEIDLAADSAAALAMPADLAGHYRQLAAEAAALFGAHHYRSYRFLLTLSDHVAHFGLEHHESSDDRVDERSLLDDDRRRLMLTLLPHEYVHSWNGKYRRPAGLATPDFQVPMKGELLWIYEGLTEYLGDLLTARSRLWTPEQYRENLAEVAALLDTRPGRTWRPLVDTTVAAQLLYEARPDWQAWRRGVDFYDEGELIWLEADTILREQSQGAKSLDDFCRLFHGGESGPPKVATYTLDDVVAALDKVSPHDWRGFFRARLDEVSQHAPMGGIERGGWKLVYSEVMPERIKSREEVREVVDLSFSLGMVVAKGNGEIRDVVPGLPAARAGVGPGMRLVAVNGRRWNKDVLRDAVKASSKGPIELLVENSEYYKSYPLDYHGGERFPHLERVAARPDLLSKILQPLAPPAK